MTMRKTLIAIAAILLIAMVSPVAFADTAPVANSSIKTGLTDKQYSEVKPILDKMLELKKELFQKYVDQGLITKEDADARIQWMEQNQENAVKNGIVPGMGKGGRGRGFGGCGGGGCGGGGCGGGFYNGAPANTVAPTANQL